MKRRLKAAFFSALFPSFALGQTGHTLDVSSYIGLFKTSVNGSPQVQIFSPLGVLVDYSYSILETSGLYGQYTLLRSEKHILLNGVNLGYEYFVFGGENSRVSAAENTDVISAFPQSLFVFSALAFRFYNLEGIVDLSNNIFRPTVPMNGKIVGLDLGLGYEQTLLTHLKMSARASVLIPKFIGSNDQNGMLIAFATGLKASL